VFRICDARTGQTAPVEGARPGRLSMHLAGPAAGLARLGDLRAAVVGDIIRRVAEQHRLHVAAWQQLPAGPAGGQPPAARDDLNIYPLEFVQDPPDPLDVSIAASEADAAHGALWVCPGDTAFIAEAAESRETAGVPDAAQVPHTPPETSRTAGSSPAPHTPPEATRTAGSSPAPHTPRETSRTAGSSPALHTPPETSRTAGSSPAPHTPPDTTGATDAGLAPTDLTVRGLDPLALRFAFLTHHYRAPMVLRWGALEAADQRLREWRKLVADWARSPSQPMSAGYLRDVLAAFDGDLDTPAAVATLTKLIDDDGIAAGSKFETFAYLDRLLGLDLAREVGH
jgi:cysteinyl-tRNA synthetase